MLTTDESAARTCHKRIAGGSDRRREEKTIGKLLISAHDSTAISCSAPHDWSSRKIPKTRAMMPGQIIARVPRTRTNVIAANVVWASWLLGVIIGPSLV